MMSVKAASAVRTANGAFANGYSWLLASINRSTTNKGAEKRHNMNNAEAYSARQAKLDRPARNCTAAVSEAARKNAKLRQKTLKVRIRCAQREKTPAECGSQAASFCFVLAGEKKRSTAKTMP